MAAVDRFHRVRLTDRLPRRRTARLGLAAAGIGLWGWTLFVMALGVIVWELPFFRANGEVCGCPFRGIELPSAVHGSDLELGPVLTVEASGAARLDHTVVRRAGEPHDARLGQRLDEARRVWGVLRPGEPFSSTLVVGADGRLPWGALRPLLDVALAQNYTKLHFVVAEPEDLDDGVDWDRFRAP